MASEMPRYIMRNCALWVDKFSRIGQAEEVTLPELKKKMEEVRNAGMKRPTEVEVGHEKMEAKFKETAFDPAILALYGVEIGTVTTLMVTGALIDEDGTVHSAVAHLEGKMKEAKPDAWAPGGKKHGTEYTMAIDYYRLEIDGIVIHDESLFETGNIRKALLL